MIIRCKSCGIRFELQSKEIAFYTNQGWEIPKHCPSCRAKRRIEKSSCNYGLKEAFKNYTPCKKRINHVYYRPYIVGGFR